MRRAMAAVMAAGALAGCAGMGREPQAAVAPQPARPVDAARFYTGDWREIARNPMTLTDGCVAGLTQFIRTADGALTERDSCRMGDPVSGKEKVFAGPVTILDPGTNAKFRADYKVFGLFHVSRTYWVLDHGDEGGGWFITATPDLKTVSIFTRSPRPPAALKDRLVERTRALGYDPAGLEFPVQPPSTPLG